MFANRWRDATVIVAATLAACAGAALTAALGSENIGFGEPPALAPGQPPQLPKPGSLAQPRSQNQVGLPATLTKSVIPPGSLSPAKIALGENLFFDARLSGDGTVACATCHNPARAFTDGRAVSVGIAGRQGQRNAPTILNALYNKTQFWDGRVRHTRAASRAPDHQSRRDGLRKPRRSRFQGPASVASAARCSSVAVSGDFPAMSCPCELVPAPN